MTRWMKTCKQRQYINIITFRFSDNTKRRVFNLEDTFFESTIESTDIHLSENAAVAQALVPWEDRLSMHKGTTI